MNRLKLGCTPLDDLLGDGIESGIITKIYGEAGTGKTNICLQASRECIMNGGKVAYIDTEGVSVERLCQMCTGGYDFKKILGNILFFTPNSFEEQEKMVYDALSIDEVRLVVVDTINMFYRVNLEDDKNGTVRSFIRQMTKLLVAAREKDLYVILTEQVFTDKNGNIKPFTSRDTEHMAKTVIKLEKKGIGTREATIIKHRFQPEGKKTCFKIGATGLE